MAGQHDDGRLEPIVAQRAHRLAAIHVGKADVHQHEIERAVFGGVRALGRRVDALGVEFLVQRKLLHQHLAQLVVVVDDEDFSLLRHVGPARPRAMVTVSCKLNGIFWRNQSFGGKRRE